MPIQILPPRLANQIAAGEVVERPASVVKELVENSLDSGATSIEIDIEKGGHKRICIRDNGSGIPKLELALALSRHATSKIVSLDDLESIMSLGFRGEALASVSSVARLTLSSKPSGQEQGWQAHCEGTDMAVQINPVAHPNGTSVEVCDLFFNTPARRKFLKTEKTEFAHIDEVVRRIALSRFDVGFTLKHNGKVLRKYPLVTDKQSPAKRLEAICGKTFAYQSLQLHSEYQGFKLTGWILPSSEDNTSNDFQYFYVNGRVMRDKLIHHALRQALEEYAQQGMSLCYVLYLTLPADQVDVNVHPAKHEVRFHQARMVHDFIYRALVDGLKQLLSDQSQPSSTIMQAVEPSHDYIHPLQRVETHQVSEGATTRFESPQSSQSPHMGAASGRPAGAKQAQVDAAKIQGESYRRYQDLMTPKAHNSEDEGHVSYGCRPTWLKVSEQKLLVSFEQDFYLIAIKSLMLANLTARYQVNLPISQPLLMPVSIQADSALLENAKALHDSLLRNSIEIAWTHQRLILKKVPSDLRHFPWADVLYDLVSVSYENDDEVRKHILSIVVNKQQTWPDIMIEKIWQEFVETQGFDQQALVDLGHKVPLADWISQYE